MDRDRNNNDEDNLAFLCLPHHDEYDSRRSQSKRFAPEELRKYRTELYARIEEQPGLAWPDVDLEHSSRPRRKHSAPSLEVYDRRIRIYRSAKELIAAVVSTGTIELGAVGKFSSETDEALFLFDREVSEFLADLYKHGVQLATLGLVLQNIPVGEERVRRVDRQMEIVLWFNEQFGPLRAKLAPYLLWAEGGPAARLTGLLRRRQ